MKRLLYVLSFVFAGLIAANAQNFEKGNVDLGLGIGLGSPYSYGSVGIPPVFAQIDFGVHDKISVGANIGYTTSKYGIASYNWRYNYLMIGARGNYHWGKHIPSMPEKLDLYAGVNLGYYIVNVNYDGYTGVINDGVASSIYWGGHVGARWFFKENLAALAELGNGIAYIKVGLNFRLK